MKLGRAEFKPIIKDLHKIRRSTGDLAILNTGQVNGIGWDDPEGHISMVWNVPKAAEAASRLLHKNEIFAIGYGVDIDHTDSTLVTRFGINDYKRGVIELNRSDETPGLTDSQRWDSYQLMYEMGLNNADIEDIEFLKGIINRRIEHVQAKTIGSVLPTQFHAREL